MTLETFQAHGRQYEIDMEYNGREIEIRAFYNGNPANGFSYHVTLEVAHDFSVLVGQNAVKVLSEYAKADVIEQRYENLVKVLKEMKQ